MNRIAELNRIIQNNRSGSSELLDKLNKWFTVHRFTNDEYFLMFDKLLKEFSEFRNIEGYLNSCIKILKRKGLESLLLFFQNYEEEKKLRNNLLIDKSMKQLSKFDSFMTISNSHTLQDFFITLSHTKKIKVFICEGRPVFEGRILATNLFRYNIEVSLITEAMMADKMKIIDAVLIGADKIIKNKSVINKVGSKPLAICAKYFKKPFYVIASNTKFSDNINFTPKKKSRKEIWIRIPPKVHVENYYFEEVENKLITKIITN